MSLYIGKDNSNNAVIHITNSILSKEALKLGRHNSTCFLSNEPLYVLDDFFSTTLSSSGATLIPTDKYYYFDNSTYSFFIYVYDISIGCYIEAGNADCYVIKNYNNQYLISSENNNIRGQNCFIFCSKSQVFLEGAISISKENITFNNQSIFGRKYIYFLDSYVSGPYENLIPLQSGRYVGVLNLESASSIIIDNKSIKYKNSIGATYIFASEINSTRLNGIFNVELDKSNLKDPAVGFSINIPENIVNGAVAVTVSMPYSYSFYQLGSGISGSTAGYMRTTFKPSINKSTVGIAPLPFTYFKIEYDYSLRTCSLIFAPQPGAGVLILPQESYPKARLSSI